MNRSSASEVNLYSYNLEGRLATAAINQQTNKYFYNQSGIRTRMETFGSLNATNIFLNDPQNLSGFSQVLEELPSVGVTPTVTYTLGSQVIGQEKSGTVSFLMSDGHGSTRLLTGSTGTISDRYSYDAYGNGLDFTATMLNPPTTRLLYSGEQFDVGLQQYYLRARYYNPTVGRFGVQDQVDGTPNDPLNLHKYAYCQNNPVNMHDPSGNQGDIGSMMCAMSIGAGLDAAYNGAVLLAGYNAAAKVTEIGQSFNSTVDAASRNASPDVDTATIIIHGVAPHQQGWSTSRDTPFQQNLENEVGNTPKPLVENLPLKHDFYEFNWGGFSVGDIPGTFIPIKSVHEMALVQLQMEEMLVSMNGYANIDIISHSWGTCLSYDLLNNSGIEIKDWVTMGSPLKHSTPKPAMNAGKWINCYDTYDPVTHLEMFPPFPNLPLYIDIHGAELAVGYFGNGLADDRNVTKQLPYDFGFNLFSNPWVHSDYWNSRDVLSDLRQWLQ